MASHDIACHGIALLAPNQSAPITPLARAPAHHVQRTALPALMLSAPPITKPSQSILTAYFRLQARGAPS